MERMKILPLLIILLCTTNTLLFAQYAEVFKLPFPQQYVELDTVFYILIKEDTLNARATIQQMQTAAELTHDERTILNFKRFKINYDFSVNDAASDTAVLNKLLGNAQAVLQTVNEKKYPEIAAMLNNSMAGVYYFKTNRYSLAFAHYLKAYDLFKNVSVNTFPNRHYTQYQIALAYYQFNDYNNAIRLGKEIESVYPVKDYNSVFTMQMIGVSYCKLKLYDSALAYYKWVLNNTGVSINPTAWKGIAMGSIGNIYFYTNQFHEAIPYLDSGVRYTLQTNIDDNTADFASNLSTIYLKQGTLPLAKKYIDIAHIALHRSYTPLRDVRGYRWLSNCNTVYHALSDYYKGVNNSGKALMYADSATFYKDSLSKRHDVNLKYQGEMLVEKEKVMRNEQLFQQQQSKQKMIRNSLLVFIAMAMIVTVLLYNRYRLKMRHREQKLLSEKQLAETELQNAGLRLNEFTTSIIEKNELIEKTKAEIEKLRSGNRQQDDMSPTPASEKQLQLLQESVLLTDDDWKRFTQLFDKVHSGFLIRLKEKIPNLSPAETRFLVLSKLKLNTKEMASMLGVSTDAIRQTRSRLKKKLHLVDDAAIENALESI